MKKIMMLMVLLCSISSIALAWSIQPNKNLDMPDGSGDLISKVLGALQMAGMIVGIFILIFFGFKYLTAGAGEKAKTKEMLVPFLIGAAVIILAPALAKWVWGLANPAASSATTPSVSSSTTNTLPPLPAGKGKNPIYYMPWEQ